MRVFACTRMIPVGGTAQNPKYRLETIHVHANSGPEAALTIAEHQADEKVRMWGTASANAD